MYVLCMCVEGAIVCAKSRSGGTAVTEAAANGHTEIVNLLNRHLMSTKSNLGIYACAIIIIYLNSLASGYAYCEPVSRPENWESFGRKVAELKNTLGCMAGHTFTLVCVAAASLLVVIQGEV